MKVIQPRIVTDAILSATNLVETDNVPYAPTTTYAKGARVRRASVFDFTSGALPAGATLTRASSGTYTASNGLIATAAANVARFEYGQDGVCRGLLVEPQRTNYQVGSGVVNSTNYRVYGTRTAGSTGPDGAASSRIVRTQSDGLTFDQYPSDYGAEVPAPRSFSAFVRRVDAAVLQFTLVDANTANFDLVNGAILSTVNANATIKQAGAGFYRAVLSHVKNNQFGFWQVFVDRASSTATTGVEFACVQLEDGLTATSYIPTTTAAATRAADVLTLNWASKGATDGTYTARYTFDDGSTQELPAIVSSGVSTVPTSSLNRTIITRVQLTALLDGVRIYESLQANNTGHALTDAAWWLDAGPTNRWAMFDGAVGSLSRATGSISVTLKPDVAIDALAVLEVMAASVRVQISTGGASVYDQTKAAGAAPASLTFLALPAAVNATVTVTIAGATGTTPVSAGALLIGNLADLGLTEAGPSIGINDFSKRQTDDFGVTTVVERGWAKRMSIRSKVDTSAVADLQQRLTTLRALPSLWIGEEGFDSLIIYGFFKEFAVDLALDTISFCTITIEGMTSAADLDQDTEGTIDGLTAQVNAALAELAVIQSDGFLSAGEKPDIIRRANDAMGEAADIVAKATALGVASAGYTTAYNALATYLNSLAPAYTDTTTDTAIVPAAFNSKFSDFYLARTTLLNAISAKAATMALWNGIPTGSGKPEDYADVTKNNQIAIGTIAPINYAADYMGVVPADAKAVVRTVQVTKGGVSVRGDATTTYALANISPSLTGANGNLAVSNAAGDRSTISLSQFSGPGTADLIVTVAGSVQPAEKIVVTITNGPAPSSGGGGGGGGGSGSTSSANLSGKSVSSTALTELYKFAGIVVTAGKTLSATAALQYGLNGTAAGSRIVSAKFQYAPTGGSTWTDMGSLQTGSATTVTSDGNDGGTLNFNQFATPSAATYDVRIVAAIDTAGRSVAIQNSPITASVSA